MKTNKLKIAPKSEGSDLSAYDAEKNLRRFCEQTSHELGNVLGALVGELDYALAITNRRVRDRAMGVSLSAAERALTLARNLRYFAVHTNLNPQTVDLSQVLLDTIDLVENELEVKGFKLSVSVEDNTYVAVDPNAFQQILLNLIAHATQPVSKKTKIEISLRQSNYVVEIRITDPQSVLNPEDLERLFEPYQKSPQQLGLAVAKALVEAHGGEVVVQSTQNVGTTFTVQLPFDPQLPKPSQMEHKRKFRRVKISLPVHLTLPKAAELKTELSVLSLGGCFTLIRDPQSIPLPELNEIVSLKIFHFDKELVEIPKGRIASVCWAGNHSGIGVDFLELDDKAKKLLSAIVKSHSY